MKWISFMLQWVPAFKRVNVYYNNNKTTSSENLKLFRPKQELLHLKKGYTHRVRKSEQLVTGNDTGYSKSIIER